MAVPKKRKTRSKTNKKKINKKILNKKVLWDKKKGKVNIYHSKKDYYIDKNRN